jgi:hypothetical protein
MIVKMWAFAVKEKHRLKVTENRKLRRIFLLKTECKKIVIRILRYSIEVWALTNDIKEQKLQIRSKSL